MLKFKSSSIRKNVVKTFKKCIPTKKHTVKVRSPLARLPDVVVGAICPSLGRALVERDRALQEREAAIAFEKAKLRAERLKFNAEKVFHAEKQGRIKKGMARLFRDNRLYSQRQLVEQQRKAAALEAVLCEAAQQELDAVTREHERSIAVLLAATAMQSAATSAALESKAKAVETADRLAQAIITTGDEHRRLQELTSAVEARFKELGRLVADATAEQAAAHTCLQAARHQTARFETRSQDVETQLQELSTLLSTAKENRAGAHRSVHVAREQAVHVCTIARTMELTREFVEGEEAEILRDARSEARKRLAGLTDARTRFEEFCVARRADLAGRQAQLEILRIEIEKEKEEVKREKERARLLGVEAEHERAASVDAKQAALEELKRAIMVGDQAQHASPVVRQCGLSGSKTTGGSAVKNSSCGRHTILTMKDGSDSLSTTPDGSKIPVRSALKNSSCGMHTILTMKDGADSLSVTPVQGKDRAVRISTTDLYQDKRLSRIPQLRRHMGADLTNRADKTGTPRCDLRGHTASTAQGGRARGHFSSQQGESTRRSRPTWLPPSSSADENNPQPTISVQHSRRRCFEPAD